MDIPILKYVDVLIGFALIMILAGTLVSTATQLIMIVCRSRGRHLRKSIHTLLSALNPQILDDSTARTLAEEVLRSPMIGKVNWLRANTGWLRKRLPRLCKLDEPFDSCSPGTVIKREELVCRLLDFTAGHKCTVAGQLRNALGIGQAEAAELRRRIEKKILQLESENTKLSACERETQALNSVLEGTPAHAPVSRLTGWFDHAMNRVTLAYASEAKMWTAGAALVVAVVFQLDSFSILQRLATDEKMRMALVQQAEKQQKQIDELKKQQAPGPTSAETPADDLELLKLQKAALDDRIMDLTQTAFNIVTPFYQTAILPATGISSGRYEFVFGTKVFPVTMERHDLSELATRINALKADVVASAGSDGRSPALIIQAHRPNIKTLELRGEAEGVNLMGPPKLLTEKSAEARSEPIASLEAGSYCLSLGRRTYEVTFREKQKPEDVAKAINALNGYVKASAVDGPSCNECVLVLTAALPDLEPIKLLTDSGRTNLIRNTATRIRRLQAATDRISVQGPREYQLSVGTRTYETVKLGEKDEPSALANGLNKLLTGSDLTAEMTKASGEGCKDCYTLTLTGNVPDLRDLGFRKRIGATNLLGSVGSYYCVANLWNSWKGILTTWLLLILGTPFWYDILKNMLRLRPLLAREEEQERAQRQERR